MLTDLNLEELVNKIPDELDYTDLNVVVKSEYLVRSRNGPMEDYGDFCEKSGIMHGLIKSWTYSIYDNKETKIVKTLADFLHKEEDNITQKDIDKVDINDFLEHLKDFYREEAEDDAAENYEDDDVSEWK